MIRGCGLGHVFDVTNDDDRGVRVRSVRAGLCFDSCDRLHLGNSVDADKSVVPKLLAKNPG